MRRSLEQIATIKQSARAVLGDDGRVTFTAPSLEDAFHAS
jgi:hypothetical protein